MKFTSSVAEGGLWLGSWARFILGTRLAPFVPTPLPVCAAMLRLAEVGRDDVLADLGCGDGRLCVLGVREFGAARAVGYEYDSTLAAAARQSVRDAGLASRVEIHEGDAAKADLRDVSVVTLYLSTSGNRQLLPALASLPERARVISFHWPIEGIAPSSEATVAGGTKLFRFDQPAFGREIARTLASR